MSQQNLNMVMLVWVETTVVAKHQAIIETSKTHSLSFSKSRLGFCFKFKHKREKDLTRELKLQFNYLDRQIVKNKKI